MHGGKVQIESCWSGVDDSVPGYVWRPLVSKTASCSQPAALRHLAEMSAISWTICETGLHIFGATLQMHPWVHECFTQVLTRTVARFTKSRLISLRASFKHKVGDTNSSDLSAWSSFALFRICTAVPNVLPVLAFADSKRSQRKRISNDSKPLLAWFGGMPSAQIFLYHPSTKTGVSLDEKSCTAGIEKTEPWPCPSNLALSSIDCVRFRVKAHFSHHHRHHHHRKQVQLAWGCAWKRFTSSRWKMALRGEANHTLQLWRAFLGQSLWKC